MFENRAPNKTPSRFVWVVGASWTPSIDPKRLQKKTHNDFEEDRTRRGEKKDNTNGNRRSTEVIPIIELAHLGARGSLGKDNVSKKIDKRDGRSG